MTTNGNATLVRRYLKAFNERDRETMAELLAEDVVEHGLGRELRGLEEIEGFLDAHFETFPDYSGTTDVMIAEGDVVAVRYTVSGTHTGEYEGVEPSGQQAEWSGIAMYRTEGDVIAEIWIEEDRLGLLEQLEMLDRPGHLRL